MGYLDYEYDDAHRMTALENNAGERIEYTLNAAGNRLGTTTKNGSGAIQRLQNQVFDELSRLHQSLGANGQVTEYSYDDNGNTTAIKDGLNHTTNQTFDALDRLIAVTDPLTNTADYDYDTRDNLTQVSDPRGIVTGYVYDGLDNLIQEASADAGTTVNLYDAAGNLTQSTDARGVVVQYAYDALNRLTAITYPASPAENVTYTYDTGTNGIGRLASISDASGSITFAYDDRGNVTAETRVIDGQSYATAYSFDLADKLTAMTYPSGRIVSYSRDALGRITQVTTQADATAPVETVASSMAYLPFGSANGWTFGNGVVASHTYDQDYRLTELDEGSVLDRSYGYSLVNNIVSITNHLDTSRSQTFGYDPLQRLTDATGVYGDIDYTYDAVGNRLTRAIVEATGTLSETYAYDTASNRLLSVTRDDAGTVTTRTLGYTAGGNITSDSGHDGVAATYTYNDRNRYTALAKGAVSADYEHNALGQRVRKTVDGATTHFHYDTSGQLIAESDVAGAVLREYLYADGRRLAMAAVPSGGTPEILTLDSEDPSATVVGNWKSSSAGGGYLGTQYETHKKANSATAWVIWPFSLTTSGDYEVYARWVDHPKRATNATYTIDNGALSQSVQVDQTANGGAWQLLGTYTLDAAQGVTVTLTNDANDTVVADGVELRKIGGSTAPALFYYHNDHLGTPQRLTDASGSLAWDADYEPFGETDELTSSVSQALRFPGQYADGESGFSDNYFRTYDPSIGRYTQSDPIGLQGGIGRYLYAYANSVRLTDPFGLAVILNFSDGPVTSSENRSGGGQQVFVIPSGDASGLRDADTIIARDGTVIKVPDPVVVIIWDQGSLDSFDEEKADGLPLLPPVPNPLMPESLRDKIYPKFIPDPKNEFGDFFFGDKPFFFEECRM